MSTPADFKRFDGSKVKTEPNKVKVEPKESPQAVGDNNNSGSKQRYYRPRPAGKYTDFTADVGSGRQYTSFEKTPHINNNNNNNNNNANRAYPRAPSRPLALPPVADPPIEVDTADFKIDPLSVVSFSGRNHFLSNFFPVQVEIDGHIYCSVEHYYQATKVYMLAGVACASELKQVEDAGAVKSAARRVLRGKATASQIEQWKRTQAPGILLHAITQKFMQHNKLRDQLLATGTAILAHAYDRDNYFATACDAAGVKKWAEEHANQILKIPLSCHYPNQYEYVPLVGRGKNLLGAISMIVRKRLHDIVEFDPSTIVKMEQLTLR